MKNYKEAIVDEIIKDNEYNKIHKLEEMASTGLGYNGYRFFVYGGEGNNPHFHVVKDKQTICCIRLDCVEYWHENKFPKCDSKLRDIIIEHLTSSYRVSKFNITNWEYLVQAWNNDNPDHTMPEDMQMPNYKNLECK